MPPDMQARRGRRNDDDGRLRIAIIPQRGLHHFAGCPPTRPALRSETRSAQLPSTAREASAGWEGWEPRQDVALRRDWNGEEAFLIVGSGYLLEGGGKGGMKGEAAKIKGTTDGGGGQMAKGQTDKWPKEQRGPMGKSWWTGGHGKVIQYNTGHAVMDIDAGRVKGSQGNLILDPPQWEKGQERRLPLSTRPGPEQQPGHTRPAMASRTTGECERGCAILVLPSTHLRLARLPIPVDLISIVPLLRLRASLLFCHYPAGPARRARSASTHRFAQQIPMDQIHGSHTSSHVRVPNTAFVHPMGYPAFRRLLGSAQLCVRPGDTSHVLSWSRVLRIGPLSALI